MKMKYPILLCTKEFLSTYVLFFNLFTIAMAMLVGSESVGSCHVGKRLVVRGFEFAIDKSQHHKSDRFGSSVKFRKSIWSL